MYQYPGDPTNVYKSGWLATSSDGVHWEDSGAVAIEAAGDMWWKGFVRQIRGEASNNTDDALFIMNHGVYEPGKGNDALRFLTSTNLKDWHLNSTSHPDARWYRPGGRWDHMYMSKHPDGGFIGMAVSSPTVSGFAGTWAGVQRSIDGFTWTQHPPLNVTWNGVSPTSIEEGGFERMRLPDGTEKYYLIGGGRGHGMAYSMWVFSSDKIDGPYSPVVSGFRLSGGTGLVSGRFGWLAAWCGPNCDGKADGTPLISNYITARNNARADVWILPMRQPIVDTQGRLRLGYWKGNDALRGESKAINDTGVVTCEQDQNTNVVWIGSFNATEHAFGAVFVASLTISGSGFIGVALEDFAPMARSYMGHTNLPGSDYRYFGVNYSDPRQCEQTCDSDEKCKAWTYVGAGSLEDNGAYPVPRCCLKDSVPESVVNTVCFSGIKGSTEKAYTAITVSTASDSSTMPAAEIIRVQGNSATTIDRAASFSCGDTKCGVATVTDMDPARPHTLRALFRRGMWEIYIDDLLVTSYLYGGQYPLPATGEGRLGIMCTAGANAEFTNAQAWHMSLSAQTSAGLHPSVNEKFV
eukprot:TRINITY_DN106312_c0_g1_i1.p1 TRINITY_DN106312_c0_g1~~TRINITY_DN106312_c0_g1_i1.p1  ORF type:complete len:639 (+),score=38.08 TRINITY_DN106312_c0_g1_i1:182-1918(+)